MHELSIMSNILKIILEYAENNNAKRITKIYLRIGALSDIVPEWAQLYFDMISNETIASNAELVIEKVPIRMKCLSCDNEYNLEMNELSPFCIRCESSEIELLSGRELSISSIEIY